MVIAVRNSPSFVRDTLPGARLTMIGDDVLLGPCVELARHLGIGEMVEFGAVCSSTVVREVELAPLGEVPEARLSESIRSGPPSRNVALSEDAPSNTA